MKQSEIDNVHIKELLKQAQLSTDILSLNLCAQGGNNRTYRLQTRDGIFALKKYFRAAGDKRDRLASEFSFLSYAQTVAPQYVPAAYGQDVQNGLALYEFIDGNTYQSGQIDRNDVEHAIRFSGLLNDMDHKESARELPRASEAGFSIGNHLHMVSDRVAALVEASELAHASVKDQARHQIAELNKSWKLVESDCKKTADKLGIDLDLPLDLSQRCISPSDFGFHNALRAHEHVRFIDFEYAGWDDPSRMVNDFFLQPAVPVPSEYYDWGVSELLKPFPNSDFLIQRAGLLKAVYHIKWCCIMLNVLIPANLERRQFANPQLDVENLQTTQIKKAKTLLNKLEVSDYVIY